MESATTAFDEAIEELTNSISEGILSDRRQNIREGQEGAFQLSQNKIEELYREEKNISSVLQDSKVILTAQ
ncbi:MAG: hypothetical protein LUC37_02990 [Prevotella sp.]|nr:hypothetical protein [Prevotella sp.]